MIIRIALIGGQSAGKTQSQHHAKQHYGGRIYCVSEVASAVRARSSLIAFDPARREELYQQQQLIYAKQVRDEERAIERAAHSSAGEFILCDRARLCGAAYLGTMDPEEALAAFLELCETDQTACFSAYDGIIFLSMPRPSGFFKLRPHRSSYPVASGRSEIIRHVWNDHPEFHEIPWLPNEYEKYQLVIAAVDRILQRAAQSPRPSLDVH